MMLFEVQLPVNKDFYFYFISSEGIFFKTSVYIKCNVYKTQMKGE